MADHGQVEYGADSPLFFQPFERFFRPIFCIAKSGCGISRPCFFEARFCPLVEDPVLAHGSDRAALRGAILSRISARRRVARPIRGPFARVPPRTG